MKGNRFLIAITAFLFLFTGCSSKNDYHDGSGISWIQEQVVMGYLTPEEAEILMEQENSSQSNQNLEQ